MTDWGQALHAARRRNRMSQEHLASVSGVSVRTIRRAENGDSISDESLRCLCATLGLQAQAQPQDEPAAQPSLVSDSLPDEAVEASLTCMENHVLRAGNQFPLLSASVAALLVMLGAWPDGTGASFGFVCLHLAAALAMALLLSARRIDRPSAALLAGLAYLGLGILWLIHFGAGSPKPLQAVVIAGMAAGLAMMTVGVRARHREWHARAVSETGTGV